MRVTFVGSGGPVVTSKRSCSCILVGEEILLDCGCGALKNLRILGVDLKRVNYVLISHFHMDHISDLVGILWAMKMDGRTKPLTIVTPPQGEVRVKKFIELMETPKYFLVFPIDIVECNGGVINENIRACSVPHSIPALAYRIEFEGKSLCYSGDTKPSANLVELAKNVDLLIHESSFTHVNAKLAEATYHSTALQAGEVASKSNAKRLVLFHIYDGRENELLSEAKKAYEREVIVAEDLQTITI